MKFRIAILQFRPVLGNNRTNIERLEGFFDRVDGADLLLLPELANSGYNFSSKEAAARSAEDASDGPFTRFLKATARKKGFSIIAGLNETDQGKLFNTAILVGREGLLGKYRKIHLFMDEKDIFLPGNAGLPVFQVGNARIGIQICFDYLFPEPWRILAEKGADLVCHPSNLLTQNAHKCIPGLSLMNRIYIATANRTGQEGGLHFNGSSFITDPYGDVMKSASRENEELLIQDLDLALSRDKMVTPRNHAFNDRRPDSYHP